MKRNVTLNMIANIVAKVWSMISAFLFVPIYLRYLGEERYGLVSFSITLQATLFILGVGLSATLRREYAVENTTEEAKERKYKLLRSVEVVFLLAVVLILLICYLGAELIATKWLNIGQLDLQLVKRCIHLMGWAIGLHLMSDLYSGGLLGLGKQVHANILQVVWSFTRAVGVICVLHFIRADIILFFSFQIVIDAIYMVVLRVQVVNNIGLVEKKGFKLRDFGILKTVYKYAIGVVGISIISMCNTQLDKMFVAKYFDLSKVAIYNIAYSLAQIPNTLVTAIMIAVFNELVIAYSQKNNDKLFFLFQDYYKKISLLSTSVVVYMYMFMPDIIYVWIGDVNITEIAYTPARIILIGCWLLTYQSLPYYFCLTNNNTKFNNFIGVGGIIFTFIMLPLLTSNFGMNGTASSYALLMLFETIIFNYIVFRHYFRINYFYWILRNIAVINIFVVFCGTIAKQIVYSFDCESLLNLIFAIICGLITVASVYFIVFIKEKRSGEKNDIIS